LTETFDSGLLGNQLDRANDLNAIHALTRMMSDFLLLKVPVLGGIQRSESIHRSVSLRRPFVFDSVSDPASKTLLALAENLLATDIAAIRQQATRVHPEPSESADRSVRPAGETNGQRLPVSLSPYKRAHERIPVNWPVEIEKNSTLYTGHVQDITIKGAKISWKGSASNGDVLHITLIEHANTPSFPARVVRFDGDIIGVEFVGGEAEAYLSEYFARHSHPARARP